MSEKLNELKKATMASYLAKAGRHVRTSAKLATDFENDGYKDMAVANKHHPNMVTPGFEKDPEKLDRAEKSMKVNFDLRDTFKRQSDNRIKGIARAGRLLAKEDAKAPFGYTKKGTPRKPATGIQRAAAAGTLGKTADSLIKSAAHKPSLMDKIKSKLRKEETIIEAGKNPYGPGYKLVDKDGTELKVGHKFMHTSHHEGSKPEHHEITGWQSGEQRGNSSSSGRVAVRVGKGKKAYDTEYFPHVFDMKVVKEDVEEVNEVSRSTIAKVATARYQQAQKALKDKDYGGYTTKMKKAIKAADATTPNVGWSPEDDKKEEVTPVSATEKYRQIREAQVTRAKGQKSTTTHHNYYVYHDVLEKASKHLQKAGIPHNVADHSKAPVDHSVISVSHKHTTNADAVLKKNKIDFGGR